MNIHYSVIKVSNNAKYRTGIKTCSQNQVFLVAWIPISINKTNNFVMIMGQLFVFQVEPGSSLHYDHACSITLSDTEPTQNKSRLVV